MSPESDPNKRRTICKACIGCLGAASVGAVGYPVVSFLGFPQRLATGKPFQVALELLPAGQVEYGQVRGRPIVVVMTPDGPRVLSASCTHLGCSVIWDAADSVFRCPCHGAVFGADGGVVSGPVNKPLPEIEFKVEDGTIIVA